MEVEQVTALQHPGVDAQQSFPTRAERADLAEELDRLVRELKGAAPGLRVVAGVREQEQGPFAVGHVPVAGGQRLPALVGSKDNPPALTAPPNATADITSAARETLRKLDVFLVDNQEAFHNALANIDKFSASLARNSERIDQITAGLQNLTGGDDGKGGEINEAVREIGETLRSIHKLADNLDKRTEEITKGVNLFTAAGTKQINIIGADAHKTLTQVELTFKNLDKNPSRLLFGGTK